ncbi:MAG: membrane protein insertase YidC [Deltaproteobacteria bacterium]|nr:membrane protein insertase YidC [Deltaproteobacteria bacterium]
MDNEKRILLAVALSIAVLFSYQYLFTPPPAKKADTPAVATAEKAQIPTPSTAVVAQPQTIHDAPKIALLPQTPIIDEGRDITVETGLFTALFVRATGGPGSFTLHKYKESLAPTAAERLMKKLFNIGPDFPADAGQQDKQLLHGRSAQELPLRTLFIDAGSTVLGTAPWQADKESLRLRNSGQQGAITFSQDDQQGLKLSKQFAFTDRDYNFGLTLTLRNDGSTARMGTPVIEWKAHVPAQQAGGFFSGNTADVAQFTYFLKDKVVKQDIEKVKEETPIEGDILWTAIEEKYFISALLMQDQKPAQVRISKTADGAVTYQVFFPAITIQPGQEAQYPLQLYMGPKDMDILARQGSHLEKTLDFGWFDIIAKPLLMCVKFFYGFLGNYGLAIILLTIIIKILFWPLTHKSFESMKGMQKIQPELTALKEKYKDNKEEFARQQLSLYKKYNVNPLSGCLPILIQIPVFIALYNALMYSIELRHASFVSFWINDLSAKDPTYIAPIVMGLSQFLQQKMTPSASMDPMQAKMMLFMPLVFTFMFLSFPSGLVIYWLVNNVISIVQQYYINNKISSAGGKECNPSKSKPKQLKKQSR